MASIESFEKQNYESFFIAADLVDVLESGENINLSGTVITAIDKDENDATSIVLQTGTKALDDSPDGGTNNMVKLRIQAGAEANSPYKITFRIPTDLNNKWEIDVRMRLREI